MICRLRILFFITTLSAFYFNAFPQKAKNVREIVDSLFSSHYIAGCTINTTSSAIPAPTLTGTRWDRDTVTGWIKHDSGCKPIRIVKNHKSTTWGLEVENRIRRGDSIFIAIDYPWIEEDNELCSDAGYSHTILNSRGDTLTHGGSACGELDNYGAMDSVNDKMIRFAGMAVGAYAVCGNVDTIRYRHTVGTFDTCRRCTEIELREAYRYCASGYGQIGNRKHLFNGDSITCNLRDVDSAITLINQHLRNRAFVTKGDDRERDRVIKIFATKKLCECDTTSRSFPANPQP
jgi:hypothetical protein